MKTVMVVDDELDIAEAVKSILEDEGYNVVICANGREALRSLDGTRPDLAIVDIMMPVMNGYETIKAIRRHPEHGKLPLLIMSAIDPSVKPPEFDSIGLLKKPFALKDLLQRVQQLAPTKPRETT
ncbi:response regulator [Pyxidicoccus fallax]|uniref:Response regulator n=1 Tax=Pyxidicoccus fallax TaxID=394095 RepID=A0A848LFG3_9BACT|nr:response regulator [Pyxidicoccus fallax]NMO14308.1 response regulator [Pyxidicoccus fallax]NPC79277.1 response regulator [Pyxidicoccus fallax]